MKNFWITAPDRAVCIVADRMYVELGTLYLTAGTGVTEVVAIFAPGQWFDCRVGSETSWDA